MIRILIADDHAIVRRGMKQLLLEHYPFARIGEASNVEELIHEIITHNDWDVVVCDMNMPGRSGLDAIMQIKEIAPGDTVGYNRNSGPLTRPTRIATISIGYADGFLRLASGGHYAVQLRGQRAPTIGKK